MRLAGRILSWIIEFYLVVVFLRVLMDWIPVRWPRWIRPLLLFIRRITEPLLSPLRSIIPLVQLGQGMALDFSPTVLILLLFVARVAVVRIFLR